MSCRRRADTHGGVNRALHSAFKAEGGPSRRGASIMELNQQRQSLPDFADLGLTTDPLNLGQMEQVAELPPMDGMGMSGCVLVLLRRATHTHARRARTGLGHGVRVCAARVCPRARAYASGRRHLSTVLVGVSHPGSLSWPQGWLPAPQHVRRRRRVRRGFCAGAPRAGHPRWRGRTQATGGRVCSRRRGDAGGTAAVPTAVARRRRAHGTTGPLCAANTRPLAAADAGAQPPRAANGDAAPAATAAANL